MTENLVYNERSWGIDLISEINRRTATGKLYPIGRAVGEEGLRGERGESTLFPDVRIDSRDGSVIMGWELKFPNTEVTDKLTIDNAIEKANRFRTNSFLVWNVNEAVLYLTAIEDPKERSGADWKPVKSWSLPKRLRRDEVKDNRHLWMALLEQILQDVRTLSNGRDIRSVPAPLTIGKDLYASIIRRHIPEEVANIVKRTKSDRLFKARITAWALEASPIKDREVAKQKTEASRRELARALAISQIANWINKVIFAHQLKAECEDAYIIDELKRADDPDVWLEKLNTLSDDADFKSVFRPILGQEYSTPSLMGTLYELHCWLQASVNHATEFLDFSESLALGMKEVHSKESGQFSTPRPLADLLVRLTITKPFGNVLDPCCGTGTILSSVRDLKLGAGQSVAEAMGTLWGSDKFEIPLGFAGAALAIPEAMGEVQQVFCEDATRLTEGSNVSFINPLHGSLEERALPRFEAIVSNLPFVRFEDYGESQDSNRLRSWAGLDNKNGLSKADVYAFLTLGMPRVLQDRGRIGLICSNSWLASGWGDEFRELLLQRFHLEYLVVSGEGRWFHNADVVTTLMVLTPKSSGNEDQERRTRVVRVTAPIDQWSTDDIEQLASYLLTGDKILHDEAFADVAFVSERDLRRLSELGISWAAAGLGPGIIDSLVNFTVPASSLLSVSRGMRPGGEGMVFLQVGSAEARSIESDCLRPLVHQPARTFTVPLASPVVHKHFVFATDSSIEELLEKQCFGAAEHIRRFENSLNKNGRPYQDAMKGKPYWYSVSTNSCGDFLCTMNPDQVLSFYRAPQYECSYGQRILSWTVLNDADKELIFAALNSSLSFWWQEFTGFPRGLGALDRTPTRMSRFFRIPDLTSLAPDSKTDVLEKFHALERRAPLALDAEFKQQDRLEFETALYRALGILEVMPFVQRSLLDSVSARRSVK